MCDAVQDESYKIDGVEVSNFVLPLYFTHVRRGSAAATTSSAGCKKGKTLVVLRHQPRRLHRLLRSQDARARYLLAQGGSPGTRAAEDQGPRAAHATVGALQARHGVQEGAGGDDRQRPAPPAARGPAGPRAPAGRDDRSQPDPTRTRSRLGQEDLHGGFVRRVGTPPRASRTCRGRITAWAKSSSERHTWACERLPKLHTSSSVSTPMASRCSTLRRDLIWRADHHAANGVQLVVGLSAPDAARQRLEPVVGVLAGGGGAASEERCQKPWSASAPSARAISAVSAT